MSPGVITNLTALPVTKLHFGGLQYETQKASFKLGRLKCFGNLLKVSFSIVLYCLCFCTEDVSNTVLKRTLRSTKKIISFKEIPK